MFNQSHRKIEFLKNSVRKYYSTSADLKKALIIRQLLECNLNNIPKVVSIDYKNQFIEEDKVLGERLTKSLLTKDLIIKLAELLLKLHSIKAPPNVRKLLVDDYTADYKYHPHNIFSTIKNTLSKKLLSRYAIKESTVESLERFFDQKVNILSLIHSDISEQNLLVQDGSIYLIDWDDCRWDLPVIDVYGFFDNYGLNHSLQTLFWKHYPKPDYWSKELDIFLREIHHIYKLIPENITIIIPTRNRCPYRRVTLNPLYATLRSLLEVDRHKIIRNVIIGDDCSEDFTDSTIKLLIERFPKIKFDYFRNRSKYQASYTRRKLINMCRSNLFIMTDDDCIFPKNFMDNIYRLFKNIRNTDRNIAVLNIPYVNKKFEYNGFVDLDLFGKVDLKNHWVYHNFDKLPLIYKSKFVKVQTFDGLFLGVREAFIAAGNYEDLRGFVIDYAEHMSMSWRILKCGFSTYHAIGKKFLVNHLKYGDYEENIDFRKIPKKYRSIVKRANRPMINSGDRVPRLKTIESLISSFTYFYFTLSKAEGRKHMKKELKYLPNYGRVTMKTIQAYKLGISLTLKILSKKGIISDTIPYERYLNKLINNYSANEIKL